MRSPGMLKRTPETKPKQKVVTAKLVSYGRKFDENEIYEAVKNNISLDEILKRKNIASDYRYAQDSTQYKLRAEISRRYHQLKAERDATA